MQTPSVLVFVVFLQIIQSAVLQDEYECPEVCQCFFLNDDINCSSQNLSFLPTPLEPDVKILRLSYNSFRSIPDDLSQFSQLTELYLDHNQISSINYINLNISTLQILDLTHNDIISWEYIKPNILLKLATAIKELRLSENQIRDIKENLNLNSSSLEKLSLESCSLRNLSSTFLDELSSIKFLSLSGNQIKRIPILSSKTLQNLNLAKNPLQKISTHAIINLTSLTYLDLSKNHLRHFEGLSSNSLKHLDLSSCYIEIIGGSPMNSLENVNFHGNRIQTINDRTFLGKNVKILDLSENSIKKIEGNAFNHLSSLMSLDLSKNLLPSLPPTLFLKNKNLVILNLSKNYLYTIDFHSSSLQYLDVSSCEIDQLQENSLNINLPSLKRLTLSRNFLKYLPRKIDIRTLEYVDLSNNKLIGITNTTFSYLVNLKELNLRSNSFMGMKANYFPKSLVHIHIGDNLWICNCFSIHFREFYDYLVKSPSKINSFELRCHSPENVTGKPWHIACAADWFATEVKRGNTWIYSLVLILVMTVILCSVWSIRKIYAQKQLREQRERERIAEEARERIRRIQMHQRAQAQQNAPDPRELQRPPSYAEAVLLPRIDGSTHSLAGSRTSVNGSTSDVRRKKKKILNNEAKKKKVRGNPTEGTDEVERNTAQQSTPVENNEESEGEASGLTEPPKNIPVIESNL